MKSPTSSDKLSEALRSRGLKATPIRLALLEELEKQTEPLSIDELISKLPKSTDKVTVYRAMESFVEHGLARQVNLRHGHADYESALLPDHHHLVCTTCGRMEDFEDCGIDKLVKNVLAEHPNFASVQDHALEFFGTCKKCALKKK